MKPENVNPGNFEQIDIIYDNSEFSIAYGIFEEGEKCLGIRWNGDVNDEKDFGYPRSRNYPMWFILHQDLKLLILRGLIGVNNSKKEALLEILKSEI